MRRLSLTIIVILVAGAVFWLVSQTSPRQIPVSTPESGSEFNDGAGTSRHSTDVAVWKEWPRPQLALMISGEQHGYFEPCGCTSNQMGGMARRADLVKKLMEAGWEVRGVDLGGLSRRTIRQAQIKFESSLQALRDLQYVAARKTCVSSRISCSVRISRTRPANRCDLSVPTSFFLIHRSLEHRCGPGS